MKKNVIFLVVDSFLYKKIGNVENGPSPTPFIDSIRDKCIFATNLYSQGPFTESGNKALLTGSDSLNNKGYMHNLNESGNIYLDVFKANGYSTTEFFLPYYLYSHRHFPKIDNQFFTSDFLIISVWGNRLKYFSEIQKKRSLTTEEYEDVYTQLDLTFEAWDNFLNQKDPLRYTYINRIVEKYPFEKNREALLSEQEKYKHSPKDYVDDFLQKGKDHPLFTDIQPCNYGDFLDDGFLETNYFKKYETLIKKISSLQFKYSIRNSRIDVLKLLRSCFQSLKDHTMEGYLKSCMFMLFSGRLAGYYKHHNFIKMLPSCRVLLRGTVEHLIKQPDNVPLEIHLHPEELHNRTSFFTYDMSDALLLDHEMRICEDYLKGLKNSYSGEIVYDLSLLYIDDCIREAFDTLEDAGKLDNTLFVITSDHGYSYDCTPLRTQFVNNHHTENYHIPLLIYDSSAPRGQVVESYHTSKDVLPTIYQLCGFEKVEGINGQSMLDESNQLDYAISEYMGGGCPDMINRPIHFMIRNSRYLVCYCVKMLDKFGTGVLTEVYDLIEDPLELKDVKDDPLVQDAIRPLLEILSKRKEEIKTSYFSGN